jgi:dihydrodipicolinate synthase/N-acetylneuraminate lyase
MEVRGVIPPIPTPFADDVIDRRALAGNVSKWMQTKLSGVVSGPKFALEQVGYVGGPTRAPLEPLSPDAQRQINKQATGSARL